ncbi:MAG TPA: hypothetical protein VKE50_05120 [Thermoanaerobaculia bacterium]|nr:hypothetical protein [Thermoanaerobaculia bacterium]
MIGSGKWSCLRRAATPATLARWLVRGALAALGAASCLCAGSAPPAAPAASETAAPAAAATLPTVAVSPESLAGEWLFEVTRGGDSIQYSLHFAVQEGILAGSLTGPDGNVQELSKIAFHEDKVSWDVSGETQSLHYEGTFSGDSMKGTVKRSGRGRSGGRGGESGGGSEGSSSGGGYAGGGHGRGRRSGGRGGGQPMTWSAYKSVAVPGERSAPAPTPGASEVNP